MKFRLVEKREFFDEVAKKKSKKDPTKGKMGWFTSFLPDKEKGMEVLNKNLDNNTSSESSGETSSSAGDSSSGACCEDLIEEDRPLNADGSLTRKASILLDVYENSGQFSKQDLLRRSGYQNWNVAGHWGTQWAAFNAKGLIVSKKGKVFAGPNLEQWIIENNIVNYSNKAKEAEKEYNDKIDAEFKQAGIQYLNDTVSFPDNYFEN